jgi:predicted unusual protein kinase regulating ubiquinone biosynthesis (AarF/ABC1/UbiB family)
MASMTGSLWEERYAMSTHTPRINRLSQFVRFLSVTRLFLWMLWLMYRERRRAIAAQARGNDEVYPKGDRLVRVLTAFRKTALKQGVLLIKLGQFLSARIDLLPEQAIAVLSSLQDEVPPAPFAHVVCVIESELGKPVEEVFSLLERTCTAAASLGQVHKAILASTGETVAVKIQRPQIDQLVRLDLRALKFVIRVITRFVDTNNFIDLVGLYHEFERTIYEELDYVREAANAKRFKELFKDDPQIYIPRVYDQYVSRRVLVLEWIDGIKINDYAALDAEGIDRFEAAKRTAYAYFSQFFEAGFFHADPHPGNIFINKGRAGEEPIVTFVDFGMVGSLTSTMKRSMKGAFLAVLARDTRSLVNALAQLGFIGEGANHASLERDLSLLIERYSGMTLGEESKQVMAELGQDVKQLLSGQAFRIPAQFAFTGRALGTLAGVLTGLAPEFNLIEVATPYARKFLGLDMQGVEHTLQQLFIQLLDTGRAWLALPHALGQVLTQLQTGQLEVNLARSGRDNGESAGVSGFTHLFMFVASLVGGIFLLTEAHQFVAGWFCLALAGLCALRGWVKS